MDTYNNWNRFNLLMWKNWKLHCRHKTQFIFEIFLPVIFSLLLVLIRSLADPTVITEPTIYSKQLINLDMLKNHTPPVVKKWELAYSPSNNHKLDAIVNTASEILSSPPLAVVPMKNANDLEIYMQQINQSLVGIQFDDNLANLSSIPKSLKYALRFPSELRYSSSPEMVQSWMTLFLYPIFDFGGPRNKGDGSGGAPGYLREGFLAVQNAISTAFIKHLSNETNYPNIIMRRLPYPPYVEDFLLEGIKSFVSLIILLSFVYPASQTVKYITTEKEKQLKEVMKIMGLPNWLHWTAWFVNSFILKFIPVLIMSVLLKIRWQREANVAVFTHAEWSAILFVLSVYCIATVTFCFMIATFFSKATTAAAFTSLFWFMAYIPYQLTVANYSSFSLANKLLICLSSNSAMGYAFQIILQLEGTGEGLQWHNLFRPVNIEDNLSVGAIIIMMLVSSGLYMLITLYVEKISPGNYGVPEKWYFPFTKQFWINNTYSKIEDPNEYNDNKRNSVIYETVSESAVVGLSILDLTKTYGDKVAVNKLSMNLHENEITVLLGHNGAGKTTTMSMLTGMIPPTSGTAIINGSDIKSNLKGARMSLGICPQYNILFDELTVAEHITFYSRLKGMKKADVKQEVQKFVNLLDLAPKINTQAQNLSGGMKRKLSVGAALCGGSKVVLCDEPSSGMDPAARRSLWDMLEAEKKGRTIFLSTHFMDEADVLGDKIAIMNSGKLKCYGTSFFLKQKYGVGYHLICVKKNDCEISKVTSLLAKYIPEIKVENNIGSELSYQLPKEFSNVFEKMLEDLENNSEELNLNGYGISITSLEEVFMKVGTDKDEASDNNKSFTKDNSDIESVSNDEITTFEINASLSSYALNISQWKAMFLKKFLYTIRNIIILCVQNILPIFFVVLTIVISKTADRFRKLEPLQLTLKDYTLTTSVVESAKNINGDISNGYQDYIKTFGKNHQVKIITTSFMDYILELSKKNLVQVNAEYLIGATITKEEITAWFNNQLLHTAPLSLNAIHNAILRALFPSDSAYNIEVTNYPLPYSAKTRLSALDTGNNLGFQLAMNITFCMSLVSAFYILFLIKERESRAKLLQMVSGVRIYIFWLSQLIFDQITFWITSILTIITLVCFQEEGFSSIEDLGRIFFIIMLFGISVAPLTYLLSMLFSEPTTGFSRVSILNIFTGGALFVIVSILSLDIFDLKDTAKLLNNLFLLFPHYSLAKSLNDVNVISSTEKICAKICAYASLQNLPCSLELLCFNYGFKKCCVPDYFDWEEPGIGRNILYMCTVFIFLLAILFIIEYGLVTDFIHKLVRRLIPPPISHTFENPNIDEDVKNEMYQISKMSSTEIASNNLVVNKLVKYYSKFLAVNQISFLVKHSECFGLLGVNGAGKTTTFKMLTGDESITYGNAYVKGLNMKNNMNKIYQLIGYCPQFDALLEDLTGREILKIFSLLRGIPEKYIDKISNELALALNYTKHIDKYVKNYSGGNKRKLSASIALLGNPSIIYLDEPTTGMDPGARRQLWNVICRVRNFGKSIVLTSHSMEECEALCTRLAIMVNGEFQCIGSTQHLKNKFSKGIILKIKLKNENILAFSSSSHDQGDFFSSNLKQFIENEFPQALLKDELQGVSTYYIPLENIKWSKIFGTLQSNINRLRIEDYSISQTTLEEIFLEFAKNQRDDSRI